MTPASSLSDSQLADEFGIARLAWRRWQPPANPWDQRYRELAGELLARQENKPADLAILVDGKQFSVPISAQENRSKFVRPVELFNTLRRKLTTAELVEYYRITLADARKLLSPEQQKKHIKTERTGGREIGEPILKPEVG